MRRSAARIVARNTDAGSIPHTLSPSRGPGFALCRLLGLSALRGLSVLCRLSTRRGLGLRPLWLLTTENAADAAADTSNGLTDSFPKPLAQAPHSLAEPCAEIAHGLTNAARQSTQRPACGPLLGRGILRWHLGLLSALLTGWPLCTALGGLSLLSAKRSTGEVANSVAESLSALLATR